MDLDALVAEASAILDAAAKPFIAGHRAASAVSKRGDDFATKVDLAIERQVVDALVSATGIPVDGTFNYAAGSPMAAILLGLLHDGDPVAGLTWLPFMGERYVAVSGGPVMKNGVPQPPLAQSDLNHAIIGVGTFNADSRGRFPGRYRVAVLEELSRVSSRMRMHGATGIDLAYVADGVLGGSISFGDHVWDHAAGVALVRAAGGIVTNLAGEDWTPDSRSALAAAPGVHTQLLEMLRKVGRPDEY
jgi:myo-inositol-1(or 4)-monophosphatase